MPRPQTYHEASSRNARMGPSSGPPSRNSVYGSNLRSRVPGAVRPGSGRSTPIDRDHSEPDIEYDERLIRRGSQDSTNSSTPDGDHTPDEDHDDGDGDDENAADDERNNERSLRDVQEAINVSHPFGLRIWKPALYRKVRSIDSKTYHALHETPGERPSTSFYCTAGNVLYFLCFGWWIALIYLLVAIVGLGPFALVGMIGCKMWFCGSPPETVNCTLKTLVPWLLVELANVWQYAKTLINLSNYMMWPFGKFIAKRRVYHMIFQHGEEMPASGEEVTEATGLLVDHDGQRYSDDTYVVGIPDEEAGIQRADSPTSPKFATSDGADRCDTGCSDMNETASEGSDEAWHEYTASNRRYSYAVGHSQRHWPRWVPRWIRRGYNWGLSGTLFRILLLIFIAPFQLVITFGCAFFVFSLPMAKLNYVLLKHMLRHPLSISAHTPVYEKSTAAPLSRRASFNSRVSEALRRSSRLFWRPANILSDADEPISIPTTLGTPTQIPGAIAQGPQIAPEFQVILCIYNAFGWEYYKYTIDGINIIFMNLIWVIFFTLVDYYVVGPYSNYTGIGSHSVIFTTALLSSIPLAYFIGMAVASITSETGSLAVGAVINATFGSIIEIILYMLALADGKDVLVVGGIVGSLLVGLLGLPGVSMFFGGLKRKEQRFNAKSAGVTATMLIMGFIGMFIPTVFQDTFGTQELKCRECPWNGGEQMDAVKMALTCTGCRLVPVHPTEDPVYQSSTKLLTWICAGSLILMYSIGMLFTLRTHSAVIYAPPKKRKRGARRLMGRSQHKRFSHNLTGDESSARSSMDSRPSTTATDTLGQASGKRLSKIAGAAGASAPVTPSGLGISGNVRYINTATSTEYPFPKLPPPLQLPPRGIGSSVAGATQSPRPQLGASPHLRPQSFYNFISHPLSPSLCRGIPTTDGVVRVIDPDPVASVHGDDYTDEDVSEEEEEESHGHDHPNWSILRSSIILLVCTVLYSLIAEVLIGSIDYVIEGSGIGEKVLGVTLFAIVPTITEFYNAIAFAMNNNIALSLEIGSAYVMQVAMLQLPVMVAFSAVYFGGAHLPSFTTPTDAAPGSRISVAFNTLYTSLTTRSETPQEPAPAAEAFTLVFPRWDMYTVLFGTFLLTYVYIEGKSNYFKGSMLLVAYFVLVGSYFFVPSTNEY
ncbi:hypothetical protein HDU85_004813 [Gaertneriomyces sp. JEL0708]|nr:hypothetical protein HDU85_004813 [Gaertneriomyces sp. JEL0708]